MHHAPSAQAKRRPTLPQPPQFDGRSRPDPDPEHPGACSAEAGDSTAASPVACLVDALAGLGHVPVVVLMMDRATAAMGVATMLCVGSWSDAADALQSVEYPSQETAATVSGRP